MLHCAPLYVGIMSYHQKIAQVENKAYEIIATDMKKPILSKLNEGSASEVFKYLNGIKKEQLPIIQPQNINTRQWIPFNYP